ncbi:MAG: molybdate ABC transporter substrate-binding protein [Porticoccus sp.]|nr:molybdate ABC transporter substrate-binding protein [Porticoccus sp.]
MHHLFIAHSKFFITCVFLLQFLGIQNTTADTLSIAVASNFRSVMEQLSEAFNEQRGDNQVDHQINISSASSGILYAQILRGAPFQLFFSANESYPEKLVASGHGVADTLATYAIGTLVMVSRGEREVSEAKSPKEILSKAKRIAIANPRTAPYGIAAIEALESLGVAHERQPTLVVGNNIAQAWQFFHSDNVDVAIVAASLVNSVERIEKKYNSDVGLTGPDGKEKQQSLRIVDLSSYLKHPVRQGRVAIKPMLPLAQEFLDFMRTSVAEKIITEGGYLLPVPADTKSSMNAVIIPPIMSP